MDELKEIIDEFNRAAKEFIDNMVAKGWNRDSLNSYFCLRFHPTHQWGVVTLIINGAKHIGICQPSNDEGLADIAFISPPNGLIIYDSMGNLANEKNQIPLIPDPIPDKTEMN